MEIDKNRLYEAHRPKELGDANSLEQIRRLLSKEDFVKFMKSRERAGTAGPMMTSAGFSKVTGEKLDSLFTKALLEGASPCYVDEETGQVFMGHYVFVPEPDNN